MKTQETSGNECILKKDSCRSNECCITAMDQSSFGIENCVYLDTSGYNSAIQLIGDADDDFILGELQTRPATIKQHRRQTSQTKFVNKQQFLGGGGGGGGGAAAAAAVVDIQ
uniref:EB domain-containing protein n=1 Tax=Syphacia muris TaxID=451379 RepID=A0A0N5AV32_9BILA